MRRSHASSEWKTTTSTALSAAGRNSSPNSGPSPTNHTHQMLLKYALVFMYICISNICNGFNRFSVHTKHHTTRVQHSLLSRLNLLFHFHNWLNVYVIECPLTFEATLQHCYIATIQLCNTVISQVPLLPLNLFLFIYILDNKDIIDTILIIFSVL